jgi:hypothetical protein
MKSIRSVLPLAAAAALACGSAGASMALPAVQHEGTVSYLTGGVGLDEAQAMKQQAVHYPLALEFVEQAGQRGEYSAGEQVQIRNASGKTVLSATAGGPFMLVNLPDGRYRVSAVDDGHREVRNVTLSGKHDRVAFVWPAQEIQPH